MINYIYYIFYLIAILSIIYFYYGHYFRKEKRKEYRLKFNKRLKEEEQKIGSKHEVFTSKLQYLSPKLTYLNYTFIRSVVVAIVIILFLLKPYLEGQGINSLTLIGVLFFIYSTSSKQHKLSLVHYLLDKKIEEQQYKKNEEILILYSLIQAEIETTKNLNSYAVIEHSKDFFKHIKPAILEYLYHFKDQEAARKLFIEKANTPYAEVFINLIHNIESLDKERINEHLNNNSEEYAILTNQNLLKRVEKKDISYSLFFNAVFGINFFWFLYSLTDVILSEF